MTPREIIMQASSDGVTLTVSAAGSLKATGDTSAVNRWLPIIRERKPGIIEALTTDRRPPARRPPTDSERAELLALVQAVYATDSDQDRQEATDCAMADPDGALLCYRAIAAERGLVVTLPAPAPAPAPPACGRCRHRATPGRADPGYCAVRTDQPPAYGTNHPLHRLPDDGGTSCPMFEARQP
ncbi:MAG: hypothetical protein WCY08_06655 [Rhodocyclaceae bacterium]